ncbi:BlaI/MecI/CopY family transcriptional regulator [Brevundimonas sp.]|uniref:BlaI/MecI/CopY family transcriptional regulator n=1 Tax=Brevundimonas sp. TaxID=1871086 RepID=UPI00345C544B
MQLDRRGAHRPRGAAVLTRIAVTEAESAVLAALWRCGPLSAASLMDEVKSRQPWGDATIKTLLHRLMQKGAVRSEREDGRQRYHAVLARDVWLDAEIGDLVDRLFGGDFEALVAHARRDRSDKG